MNQITDQLAVSDASAVRRLPDDHNYDLVITLGYFDQLGYSCPDASDTGDRYVFPDGSHDYRVFERAVDAVRTELRNGKSVLVHCQAGCSRSPAVCIAALACEDDLSYDDALDAVSTARAQTNLTPELEASARRYVDEN